MGCADQGPLGIFNMVDEYAIPQGADWDVALRYLENGSPVDFSGGTARMQVRRDHGKNLILELSTNAGTISLGNGSGDTPNVVLHFTAALTSAATEYEGIYDLEVTSAANSIYKFIEGELEIHKAVTI
jgi:hypothetical protein